MLILAMVTQQSWAEGARGAAKAALAPLEEGTTQLASSFDRVKAVALLAMRRLQGTVRVGPGMA
jgi:hypothetical protein